MELKVNKNIEIHNSHNDAYNPYREYLAIDENGSLWIVEYGQGYADPIQLDEDIMKVIDNDRIKKMLESAIQEGWTEAAEWIKDFVK